MQFIPLPPIFGTKAERNCSIPGIFSKTFQRRSSDLYRDFELDNQWECLILSQTIDMYSFLYVMEQCPLDR